MIFTTLQCLCQSYAVTSMDYVAVSNILTFGACESRSCLNITVINDKEAEPDETFFITLERTSGLNSRITLRPEQGEIKILNDDDPR